MDAAKEPTASKPPAAASEAPKDASLAVEKGKQTMITPKEVDASKVPSTVSKPPDTSAPAGTKQGDETQAQVAKNQATVPFTPPTVIEKASDAVKDIDDNDKGAIDVTTTEDETKPFHSTLGLLTRKIVNMFQGSESGRLDMNECAILLGVPKRRLYDITNVLEGIGMIEKKNKSVVAWKGSGSVLGGALDVDSRNRMDGLRKELTDAQQEEAQLDKWLAELQKKANPSRYMYAQDVVKALLYPRGYAADSSSSSSSEALLDSEGRPTRGIILIQHPRDSVACLPPGPEGGPERQLYVGTQSGAQQHGILLQDEFSASTTGSSSTRPTGVAKRKRVFSLASQTKNARGAPRPVKIAVNVVPTFYDDTAQTIKMAGIEKLEQEAYVVSPEVEAIVTASNTVADSLKPHSTKEARQEDGQVGDQDSTAEMDVDNAN